MMIKVTKAAKGIAYGDVSNSTVRNILSEISVRVFGKVTQQDLEDSLDFFDWKCPYTGVDLRDRIENNKGGFATDHIIPQNREECGLNVRGNLVIVDSKANSKKSNKTVEEFLLKDTDVLGDFVTTPMHVRQQRLDKIREFQAKFGYDPVAIKNAISDLMKDIYDEVRLDQEKRIDLAIKMAGLTVLPIPTSKLVTSSQSTSSKNSALKIKTELILVPSDENEFKEKFISKGIAEITLKYADGSIRNREWVCSNITMSSNIRSNIQSSTYWRRRNAENLISVIVEVK